MQSPKECMLKYTRKHCVHKVKSKYYMCLRLTEVAHRGENDDTTEYVAQVTLLFTRNGMF
jgi:hypothetical protein